MKDREYPMANLQNSYSPPPNWMNLISNWLSTASILHPSLVTSMLHKLLKNTNKNTNVYPSYKQSRPFRFTLPVIEFIFTKLFT